MQEKYYSPKDIAEKFNLNIRTVYAWIRQGRLRAIKLGDLWRIPQAALDEFMQPPKE
ncbi:MAG: helix-turn-helix domain-containing protein [Firmicutes bacterium]|nr:helix-turn-helix domain-containing protein [Bacillota bacterium]